MLRLRGLLSRAYLQALLRPLTLVIWQTCLKRAPRQARGQAWLAGEQKAWMKVVAGEYGAQMLRYDTGMDISCKSHHGCSSSDTCVHMQASTHLVSELNAPWTLPQSLAEAAEQVLEFLK